MIKHLINSHARALKLGNSVTIYLFIVILMIILFCLFTLFLALFYRNYILMVIIMFLLTQYNMHMFIRTLISYIFYHYSYRKTVCIRYIMFELLKYNPYMILAIIFVCINAIVSIIFADFQTLGILIINIYIWFNAIMYKFVSHTWVKYLAITVFLADGYVVLYPNMISIIVTSIVAIISVLIILNDLTFEDDNYKNKVNHIRIVPTNKVAMFHKLFLKRSDLKWSIFTFMLVCAYIVTAKKIDFFLDYGLLIVALYLLDVEIVADKNIKNLPKITAKFYFMTLSKLSFIHQFLLSKYCSYIIIYSVILMCGVIVDLILGNTYAVLNYFITTPVLFMIGMIYFLGEKRTIIFKKKFNTFWSQYVIITGIIMIFILKNWFLKI